jgi:hypothetical protein
MRRTRFPSSFSAPVPVPVPAPDPFVPMAARQGRASLLVRGRPGRSALPERQIPH